MGLLGKIGDALKGAATGFVTGGPVGAIAGGAGALLGGGGGGGGGGGAGRAQPGPIAKFQQIAAQGQQRRNDPPSFGGFSMDPVDMGPVRFDPNDLFFDNDGAVSQIEGQANGQSANGQAMSVGGFQQGLISKMLQKSVRGKKGRAILEAMTSGSLQGGMIQQPTPVQTPRGMEMHSPPGFRTVDLMGQKVSVFKPLAMTLGLLPKTTTTKVSSADMKKIRDVDTLTKRLKRLAKKTGNLKVTNK